MMFPQRLRSCLVAIATGFSLASVSYAVNPWPDSQYLYRQYGTSSTAMNARVFKPLSFDAASTVKHPVVIFFHGDGELETQVVFGSPTVGNSKQMLDNGQYVFVTTQNQAVFPCFFVLAQRHGPDRPATLDDGTMAIIAGLEAEFKTTGGASKIDLDRIHLTGLSGGGGASVIVAGQRPGVFASGVFVCPPIPPSPWWVPSNMSGLATWFFHALGDSTVTWRCSRDMVNELRGLGNRAIFTRYGNPDFDPNNEGSHSIWNQAYATPYLIPWMAAQRRGIMSTQDPATVTITNPSPNFQFTSPDVFVNFAGTTSTVAAASSAIDRIEFSRNAFVDIHRPAGNSYSNYNPTAGTVDNWSFSNGEPVGSSNPNPMRFDVVASGTSWNASLGGRTYYGDTILITKPASGSTDSVYPTIGFVSPTTGTTFSTTLTSVTVLGTAADNAGISHIGWTSDRGASGFAEGKTSWSAVVPLQAGTNSLVFKAYDTAGNATTKTLAVTVNAPLPPPPAPPADGHGLMATYFDNMDFTGTSIVRRIDANINFQWAAGSPDPAIVANTFSARWEGEIEVGLSGTYTFTIGSDDASRLWIGTVQVVDNWGDHGYAQRSGKIALVAGQRYALKMEYYDNSLDATVDLRWTPPGGSSVIVPSSALYVPVQHGLIGTYYDNMNFTGTSFSRVDPTVSFFWDVGSPDPRIGGETFSVRWEGQIEAPETGVYTFSVGSDDGSALWVGGVLVADNWSDHGHVVKTGTATLTAGQRYPVKMEYYEKSAGASAELKWTLPSGKTEVIPSSALIAEKAVETPPLRIRYDFGSTVDPTVESGWNNVTNVTVGSGVVNSVDLAGVATGVGLSVTQAFNGVNTQGSTSVSGLYPMTAMKDSIFTNAGVVGKLRFAGLESGASYKLTFFASRVASDARVAKYVVGSGSAVLNAALNGGNTLETAVIAGVAANPTGQIDIAVTNEVGSAFGYLGVLEIEKESNLPRPATVGSNTASQSGAAPALASAVSRLGHGTAGAFDVALPITGTPGVECRQLTSGACVIELTFNKPITGGTASVIGIGSVSGSPLISGDKMTVTLAGVVDGQTVGLSISNVTSADGSAVGSANLTFRVLQGDVNGDGIVTDTDVQLVKSKISPSLNSANAPYDINRNGVLNTTDAVMVSGRLGRSAL